MKNIRGEFPLLAEHGGSALAYLDSASTTQKPQVVISSISNFYETLNANIHRGIYDLSQRATDAYERSRAVVRDFVGAKSENEIVFVRGATEAINLVAQTFVRSRLAPGDEILISEMEHHSNIVPWQLVCEATGAKLAVVGVTEEGELEYSSFKGKLSAKTKFVSITHASNTLGTINPIKQIVEEAHRHQIPVLVDGAQAVAHLPVDVKDFGCDFYVFSGHKVYGPLGIGVLYGKLEHLQSMPPYQGGGDMILSVSFEKTVYQEPPFKFEAGTPHIVGAIALGTALEFVQGIGWQNIRQHEQSLMVYASEMLRDISGLRVIGTASEKTGIISFVIEGIHPHDIGTILDQNNVAIRTGHHCTQPLMERFGIPATARVSLGVYNSEEDIMRLGKALGQVRRMFR